MNDIQISFARYDLKGKGKRWLKSLPEEDRQAFSYIGRAYADHGRMGGKARAQSAWRDEHGKFVGRRSFTNVYYAFDVYAERSSLLGRNYLLRVAKDVWCHHSFRCIKDFSLYAFRLWAWKQQFPNYCPKCEGSGVIEWDDDPSPAGVSLGSGRMYYEEPCPQCIEKGACPNCGEIVWLNIDCDEETPLVCPLCDWNSNDPRVAPRQPECYCLEEYIFSRHKKGIQR